MPAWSLKVIACLLTGLATVGSALYVGGHLKNPAAPLRPPVVGASSAIVLHLEPQVQVNPGQPPLTFTSVS
ncbi:MAG TPA: hypothetical protein VNG93_11210 [Candidatus Dormibacteraeota bacterium]|nr:hypothetical protein [Candidatus Dormibacteraeota bacterium]